MNDKEILEKVAEIRKLRIDSDFAFSNMKDAEEKLDEALMVHRKAQDAYNDAMRDFKSEL